MRKQLLDFDFLAKIGLCLLNLTNELQRKS